MMCVSALVETVGWTGLFNALALCAIVAAGLLVPTMDAWCPPAFRVEVLPTVPPAKAKAKTE